ncbi:MAG TPA: TetR/AcrR family transcriptional regulator, partial [Phenylobacterium sp.]|nr:TetR/AcrR family transcriptional regulator [Phenylobacterium sp.]
MTPPSDVPRLDDAAGGGPVASRPAVVESPPKLRQTQKEATRNRVIEAARELFDTQGYQGTTIRDIATHAGVSV